MGAFFPPLNQPLPPAPPPRRRGAVDVTSPARASSGSASAGLAPLVEPSPPRPDDRTGSRPNLDPLRESLGSSGRVAALLRGGTGESESPIARTTPQKDGSDAPDRQLAGFRGAGGARPRVPGGGKRRERDRIPPTDPPLHRRLPKPQRPERKPAGPTTIIKYQDGRLFLPLHPITGKPFPSLNGDELTVVNEEREGQRTIDFDHARQAMDPELPPGRTEKPSGKDVPVRDVVVIVTDESGTIVARKKMRDPVTQQFLKVARPKDLELTQAQVDVLGLRRFDTSRPLGPGGHFDLARERLQRSLGISDE